MAASLVFTGKCDFCVLKLGCLCPKVTRFWGRFYGTLYPIAGVWVGWLSSLGFIGLLEAVLTVLLVALRSCQLCLL